MPRLRDRPQESCGVFELPNVLQCKALGISHTKHFSRGLCAVKPLSCEDLRTRRSQMCLWRLFARVILTLQTWKCGSGEADTINAHFINVILGILPICILKSMAYRHLNMGFLLFTKMNKVL